jgi:hypothetical protein
MKIADNDFGAIAQHEVPEASRSAREIRERRDHLVERRARARRVRRAANATDEPVSSNSSASMIEAQAAHGSEAGASRSSGSRSSSLKFTPASIEASPEALLEIAEMAFMNGSSLSRSFHTSATRPHGRSRAAETPRARGRSRTSETLGTRRPRSAHSARAAPYRSSRYRAAHRRRLAIGEGAHVVVRLDGERRAHRRRHSARVEIPVPAPTSTIGGVRVQALEDRLDGCGRIARAIAYRRRRRGR